MFNAVQYRVLLRYATLEAREGARELHEWAIRLKVLGRGENFGGFQKGIRDEHIGIFSGHFP